MKLKDRPGVAITATTTGPYKDMPRMISALQYIEAKALRTTAPVMTGGLMKNYYTPLAQAGFQFLFNKSSKATVQQELEAMLVLQRAFPGCVIGYEGPNEVDRNPVGKDDPKLIRPTADRPAAAPDALALMNLQRKLFKENREFRDCHVVAFNDFMQQQQAKITTYANTHTYPKVGQTLAEYMPGVRSKLTERGAGQMVITEYGCATYKGVTEEQQRAMIMGGIDTAYANSSIKMLYLYTLFDWSAELKENRFGLFHYDGTPKLAAIAMHERFAAK